MASTTLEMLLKRQCSGGNCFGQSPSGAQPSAQSTNMPNPNNTDTDDDDDYWPNSSAGYVFRYVILAAIVLFIILWLVLGIWHANRRLRKGLPPLWYHRWLVPSRARYAHQQQQQAWPHYGDPSYHSHTGTYGAPPVAPGQAYPMHAWRRPNNAPPPPIYTNDSPPVYQPPPGPPPGREPKDSNVPVSTVMPTAPESQQQSAPSLSRPETAATPGSTSHHS